MTDTRFLTQGSRFSRAQGTRRVRDAQQQAGELLLRLGMTPHTEGYAMLRDGTRLLACVGYSRHVQMTNELYPLLAASYRQNDRKSEHAMRDAIRLAWQKNGAERSALFPEDEPPSNAALLYLLAGCLRTACKQGE